MTVARDPQLLAVRLIQAFLALILLISLFLALVVPYHATDALVYGAFSKELARQGGFLLDQVGFASYARPLFYAPQGWLWWVFGAHDWIGRLFSLAFFVLLLWSVFRLACDRSLSPLAPWLAVLALFAVPDVVAQAFAGQTDVPVAALLAAAGVMLWRRPAGWSAVVLLVVLALAAVLAKATAWPALLGLALAHLLGSRAQLRDRIVWGVVPLAAGTFLGLVYDLVMARHFGVSLDVFLGGAFGTTDGDTSAAAAASTAGPFAQLVPSAAVGERISSAFHNLFHESARYSAVGRAEWLGPYVRIVLLYALLYAIARVARLAHRRAVLVALAIAIVLFVLAPIVLPGSTSLSDMGAAAMLGSVLLVGVLFASIWCPPQWLPSQLLLGRMLVWLIPSIGAWALFGIVADTRTLSPAWPPLFVLMGGLLAVGVAGLGARRAWLGVAGVALVLVLAVVNFRNFDGLGARPDGSINSLRAFRELTPSTWLHPDRARVAADPQLGGEVDGLRRALAPGARLRSNDGRMIFFAVDRADIGPPPTSCAELRDAGALVLLLNVPEPFDPTGFACLQPVVGEAGSYGVWRVR
jgi:hypothetical protein